jgi:hypothetical protein
MKQFALLALFVLGISTHTTYPGFGSPYGSQAGLFIPQVSQVKNISSANDVLYTRFCKAVCMLYVPIKKTCGLNNEVYLNDCQARCDRVGTDANRLMFNEKCCCLPGSEYIDSAWALGANNTTVTPTLNSESPNVKSSSFCISMPARDTTTIKGNINIFAIPQCLRQCLGIDDKSDLKFVDNTVTYSTKCDDGVTD